MAKVSIGGFVFGGLRAELLCTFWLDSNYYDLFDDFESYDLGAFVTNTKWTISLTTESGAAGYANIIAATINVSGQELEISSKGEATGGPYEGTATATTKTLASNKHTFVKYKYITSATGVADNSASSRISVGNGTQGFTEVVSSIISGASGDQKTGNGIIFIEAVGGNEYNVYVGYTVTNLALADGCQLRFYSQRDCDTDDLGYVYVDDLRQSKVTIT